MEQSKEPDQEFCFNDPVLFSVLLCASNIESARF